MAEISAWSRSSSACFVMSSWSTSKDASMVRLFVDMLGELEELLLLGVSRRLKWLREWTLF